MTQNYVRAHLLFVTPAYIMIQPKEGVTQRMSRKGSQTGKASGCCQNECASEYERIIEQTSLRTCVHRDGRSTECTFYPSFSEFA